MQTMSHGLSILFGAIAAWLLCLAPVAFAREPLSMPSILAPATTPVRYIANLSVFLMWITGGIFLGVGGLLALALFRFRARESGPLSGPTQVYRSTGIGLIWTVIPVLVLVLFLATVRGIVGRVARPDRRMVYCAGILHRPIGREKMTSDLQSDKRAANRQSHIRSRFHYWETADRPHFRDKATAVLMTGPAYMAEIGGKTVQPVHRVMTLVVIYWPENEHNL
jgi:Cytochrome C oxidase subunit II, transmembrane domain